MVAAASVVGGAVAAQVITYRDWVHGGFSPFAVSMVLAVVAASLMVTWAVSRGVHWWLAPVLAMSVLLPGMTLHAVRLVQQRMPLEVEAEPILAYRHLLDPTLKGEATLRAALDELVLRVPAGSIGYLQLRLPGAQRGTWYLPRALLAAGRPDVGEEVNWRASIERDGVYFVLIEADGLLVQVTGWGLLVTTAGPAGQRAAESVALPPPNGAAQDWTLRRGQGQMSLLSGGREVWAARDLGPFRVIRLGETLTDGEHGGTLRLRRLRFSRRVV